MDKVNLFISYSHIDKDYLPELFKYVNDVNCPNIKIWTDEKIALGQVWNDQIKNSLDSADIVLLLVSQDFLNSVYIQNNELTEAFKRHEEKKATVIPIFLRYCLLDSYKQITNLQGYPDLRTPLAEAGVLKDRFYITIVQKLNQVAAEIITESNISKSQADNNGNDASNKAVEIENIRSSNKVLLSVPVSPSGLNLRKNFIINADGKIKYDHWPYVVTPTIEEATALTSGQTDQAAKFSDIISGCIYFIHIIGSAEDVSSDLFKLQYNKAKEITAGSTFNRTILWFADSATQDTLNKLDDKMKTELQQIPAVVGPDNQGVFDMIDQFDSAKEKKLTELVKSFSPVKKIFMFYDFQKDNDSNLRIQLRKKLQEDKEFTIRDLADESFEEQTKGIEDCDAAVIYYGVDCDAHWYKVRERIVLKADNIKREGRVVCVDGSVDLDIERKIDRDVSVNEVTSIKGQKDLDVRIEEFKNSLK